MALMRISQALLMVLSFRPWIVAGMRDKRKRQSKDIFSVTSDAAAPELDIVDRWLDAQPRQNFLSNGVGLIRTFGTSIGGGDCGDEHCFLPKECPHHQVYLNAKKDRPDADITAHCRYDVYDNALAAIYYTKRGKYDKAKQILDAFLYYLYPTRAAPHVYGPEGVPSKRKLTLLAASFTAEKADPGMYQGPGVADGAVDLGNNAYVGMSFARYAAATGSACYSTAAHDLMAVLYQQLACDDAFGGFMGRLAPYPKSYRSIEHNIDMYAFAKMLNHTNAENKARTFVEQMYGKDAQFPKNWVVGTHERSKCDMEIGKEPIPVDSVMWNIAANADPSQPHAKAAVEFALQEPDPKVDRLQGLWESNVDHIGNNGIGAGKKYYGFRFTTWGSGIQWENAASGLVALVKYRQLYGDDIGVTPYIKKIRQSLSELLEVYGTVPSSILGGNLAKHKLVKQQDKYPGGSDTGMGWSYLRYGHVASTVWAGFAFIQQGAEGSVIDEEGNPYAPPHKAVPAPGHTACLEEFITDRPPPTQMLAKCSAHDGCAGLDGNCCPTDDGAYLGCCTPPPAPTAQPTSAPTDATFAPSRQLAPKAQVTSSPTPAPTNSAPSLIGSCLVAMWSSLAQFL